MSIALPISCCRYHPRERAVNGGPPSPNTNALSLRPTPDRRCDRQETDHARTTNCHPLVQQRVKRVHPPSFHYTRTYIHMHTHTHAHTVTQTHAGYECTLSSFLVSLPVKIPSQFLCSGTPHQSLVRLSPFHPLSTASTTRRHPSTALFNMPSPSVHLTSRRYTTHPLYSDLPAKALETATVKDLKAVVWYHATQADRTRASASRVVDPRGWSKLQLVAHVRGALRGYARKVAGADLASITAQYHRESADNSLVAGLLASVAASDSEADDEEEGGDGGQSEDGSEEGQGEESDHESSNERSRAEGQRDGDAIDDDDEPGSGGDGESGRAST